MTYYLYHIPGKKIGVTRDLKYRVEEQQGYNEGEYEIILQTDDITIASELEIQYQKALNYRVDEVPYNKLKRDMFTRHACISIYDGKEHDKFATDTPCTYAIQFTIVHNRLDMCVTMRSNDLWYGFCNDQYQFSKLQEMVSKQLDIETGVYYHFAHNMHLYNDKI